MWYICYIQDTVTGLNKKLCDRYLLLLSGKLHAVINPTLTIDTGGRIKCNLSIIQDLLVTMFSWSNSNKNNKKRMNVAPILTDACTVA